MSSLRRRYTDGPTESQKLYGSELPPSLRWGAARKHAGVNGPDPGYRSEGYSNAAAHAFPAAVPAAVPPPPPRIPVPVPVPIPDYVARRESGIYRGRDERLEADLADELAELRLERRMRSRSRGRTERMGADLAEELAEMRLERRMRSRSRNRADRTRADLADELAELRMERNIWRSRSRGRDDARRYASERRGRSSSRSEFYRHDIERLERDTADVYIVERKRRPYATESPIKDKAKPLLLRGKPEETGTDEQTDRDEGLTHFSEWLRKSETESVDTRERAVAISGRENIDTSRNREFYSALEHVRRNSTFDARRSVEAGAERFDDPFNSDRIKHQHYNSRREAQSSPLRSRPQRPAIDFRGYPEGQRSRQSRPYPPRRDSSVHSYWTSAPPVSKAWFSRSWSIRPMRRSVAQDTESDQTSPMSSKIVTELSHDPLPQVEVAPSPFQRVRSWRYNQVLPTIEPTLKRVVHATYGDLLQIEALRGANPTGFIAVPQSCSSQGDTLYHILNLQQHQLDFETFKKTVVNLPELRKVRDSVDTHFNKAQQLYEQQTHDGDATRRMNGFCHHTEASTEQARMTLIGLPFVQLNEHNHRTEAEFNSFAVINRLLLHSRGGQTDKSQSVAYSDTAHATRTLFQYLNSRDNSRRDLKQVICHMLGPRDKRYLCVSQIWIFVVNEEHWIELIITSSTLPESDICGDLLLPLTAQTTPPKRSLVNVHVVSADGRQWLLKAVDCLTYIDFAANFSDITHQLAEEFIVYHDDEEIKPSDWTQKLQHATTATLRLRLERVKDFAKWNLLVWSARLGRFRHSSISVSNDFASRSILMRRSSSVRSLGVGIKEDRSNLAIPFRRFIKKVRMYQDRKERPHTDMATDAADQDVERAQSPVSGSPEGNLSGIEWLDPEGAGFSEDKTNANWTQWTGSEDPDYDRLSNNDPSRKGRAFDLIRVLPKAATQARALVSLNIPFIEQAHDFAVAGGLNESQLFDVMQMTIKLYNLEGLRKITCECLLRTPKSGSGYTDLESNASRPTNAEAGGRPSSRESSRAISNLFDEDDMYETCSSMTRDVFHSNLRTWMASPLPDTTARPGPGVGLPSPKSNPWALRRLLGWVYPEYRNVKTGEIKNTAPSVYAMFEGFLDGLWLTLHTSKFAKGHGELQAAEEKLAGAVFTLVTTIHQYMERAEELPYHAFYHNASQCFTRLFGAMSNLDSHALTIETVHGTGKSAAAHAEHSVTLRHITIALLLATKSLTELEDETDILQAEEIRRNEAVAKISSTVDGSVDYRRVVEGCNKIFGARNEAHRQKRFQQSVDRLGKLGWNRGAARTILLSECRSRRIAHHAFLTAGMLETSFVNALTPDPSRKIQWKAAALPTDLVALLITQVLERPVFDGHDALNMYMRYITDLESNILTGEPSREPLDRIRYLRHELNAFSQLQQEQIDVLDQVTSALLPPDYLQDYAPSHDDPHPRRTVFATMPKGIQIQKDIIQSLSDMLDDLQSEARAQISGVQDWRDNAAVVFTIITVIFLPLSFVASVFGMNTSDVRNMELTQWVFWTCAIIFTIIVVLITVYFVDVPPLWRWLERKGDEKVSDKVVTQPTQRSRSHFFAGLARHSGGIAAADDRRDWDAQRNPTMKAEDLIPRDVQESSVASEDER